MTDQNSYRKLFLMQNFLQRAILPLFTTLDHSTSKGEHFPLTF